MAGTTITTIKGCRKTKSPSEKYLSCGVPKAEGPDRYWHDKSSSATLGLAAITATGPNYLGFHRTACNQTFPRSHGRWKVSTRPTVASCLIQRIRQQTVDVGYGPEQSLFDLLAWRWAPVTVKGGRIAAFSAQLLSPQTAAKFVKDNWVWWKHLPGTQIVQSQGEGIPFLTGERR